MLIPFICNPFLVQTTCGLGFPLTFPSNKAFPPCAKRALRNIYSNTGGDAPSTLTAMMLMAYQTSSIYKEKEFLR